MSAISPVLDHVLDAAGWAVVHSLWQGAGIGGLAILIITTLPRNAAASRYNTALIALFSCAAAFAATFTIELWGDHGPHDGGFDRIADLGRLSQSASIHSAASRAWFIDAVALIWACGGAWMSLRVLRQCLALHRLKAPPLSLADEPWLDLFDSLKTKLGIDPSVRLMRSGIIDVPMVVGWLAPVVLVPACAFTSLSRDQMQALLVHELSHIRRLDHWVNVIQIMTETLLFFHPIVWWLSRQMRIERENCCDDAAVQSIGSPRVFAEALVQLETLRNPIPVTALSSQGGSLMNRIARMLGTPEHNIRPMPRWLPALAGAALLMTSLVGMSHAAVSNTNTRPDSPAIDMLKDAVAAGRISADEARNIYNKIAYPGSDTEQRIEAEYTKITTSIEKQIASGKLSPEDANKKLSAVRARMDEEQQIAFAVDVLGKTRQEAQLDAQVAAGKLTAQEAQRRLESWKQRTADRDHAMADLEKAVAELQAKVQAGQLTAEDAKTRQMELRERLAALSERRLMLDKPTVEFKTRLDGVEIVPDAAQKELRLQFRRLPDKNNQAQIELENAIVELNRKAASGAISAEDAKARTRTLQEQAAALAGRRGLLERMTTELKAQVDAGKISADEASERIKALKSQLDSELVPKINLDRFAEGRALNRSTVEFKVDLDRMGKDQEAEDKRERIAMMEMERVRADQQAAFDKLDQDLKSQVAAGKITKEEAQAKLDAVKADFAKRSVR